MENVTVPKNHISLYKMGLHVIITDIHTVKQIFRQLSCAVRMSDYKHNGTLNISDGGTILYI